VGQLLGGELAQLVVDQWEQPAGRSRVTLLDGGQDLGDFAHAGQFTPRKPARLAERGIEAERAFRE
jgi:hypothetical protein